MSFTEISSVLGNWGEFLGAIAVVATLFYLAVQIRQNTKSLELSQEHAKAQTNLAYISLQTTTMLTIAASDEISQLQERAVEDWSSLTTSERIRINNITAQQLIHYSMLYGLTKSGLMRSSQIEGARTGLSLYFASNPIARKLWPRIRGYDWDRDMADYVDSLLGNVSSPSDLD